MAVATDYRDSRKSAYQQFAAASDFNVCKLPPHVSANDAAPLGVAFVAAVLALGICLGVRFDTSVGSPRGPDLLRIVRALPSELLPEDIRSECFDGIPEDQRAKPGDWLAIWGGTPTSSLWISLIPIYANHDRLLRHGLLCCPTRKVGRTESNSSDRRRKEWRADASTRGRSAR